MNGGMSDAGEFFYGFLSKAIKDFFQRIQGKETDKTVHDITIIESWLPIITMLEYLKAIHNVSQNYLLSIQYHLFGKGDNKITSSNTTPDSMRGIWNQDYHELFYPNFIKDLEVKQKSLFENKGIPETEIAQLKEDMKAHQLVKEKLIAFEKDAPEAHKNICEFIKTLEKIAKSIKRGNLEKINSWGDQVKGFAKKAAGHSDDSIVNLIPILTYLYEKAIRPKQ